MHHTCPLVYLCTNVIHALFAEEGKCAQDLKVPSMFYFVHEQLCHLSAQLCANVSVVRANVHNCVSCPLAECAYCGPGKCYNRSKSVVVLDGDCFTCLNSLLPKVLVHSLPPVLSVDVKVRLPQCRVSLCYHIIHIYHIQLNIPHTT